MVNLAVSMDVAKLKNFILGFADIGPHEWLDFARHLRIKKIEKGELFFTQGEKCDDVGFVLSGLVYTYYSDRNGDFAVKNFAWEGRLIAPYAAQLLDQPAFFTAKAWETTWIASIQFSDLRKFFDRKSSWERIGRRAAESIFIERERREYEALLLTPQERYSEFTKSFAPVIDRIPQWMIASYIGITPVALSRILNSKDRAPSEGNDIPFPTVESGLLPKK